MKKKLQAYIIRNDQKQIILDIAFVLFLLSLLRHFIVSFFSTFEYESWQISEFLINYQDGFVRRGLSGELLYFIVQNFDLDVLWTIKIICLASVSLVSLFFFKAFLKKGFSLYILPLCFFLSAGILSDYWIRKDYLLFCFFIPVIWLYGKTHLSILSKTLLINLLGIFIILCHEVFVFFSVPILFLLFLNQYKDKGYLVSVLLSLASLAPIIFVFLITVLFHGNEETAQVIWNSWLPYFNHETSEIGKSVKALGWTSSYAMKYHFLRNFFSVDHNIWSFWVWPIIYSVIYYISTNVLLVFRRNEKSFTNNDKTILSSILIFQFICLLPVLLVLSIDYIRINFYWIASSFTIFLLIPKHKIENLFPKIGLKWVENVNTFLSNILRPTKTTLVFLMLFIGVSYYGFKIESYYESTMLYNTLSFISEPFVILKDLLKQ